MRDFSEEPVTPGEQAGSGAPEFGPEPIAERRLWEARRMILEVRGALCASDRSCTGRGSSST
jgi:hypothetical protein